LRFRFQLFFDELNRYEYAATLYNPFTYLTSEGFWELVPRPGYEERIASKKPFRSPKDFERSVLGARLPAELFTLLQQTESREQLRQALYAKYFPEQAPAEPTLYRQPDLDRLAALLANPSQAVLQSDPNYLKVYKQESPTFRRAAFAPTIRALYQQRCAISGQQLGRIPSALLDACHIRPHAQFRDDSLQNGMALTPTLHRAFDMGLMAVNDHYEVCISPVFEERKNPYELRQFAGKALILPKQKKYHPKPEFFAWHRQHIFLQA